MQRGEDLAREEHVVLDVSGPSPRSIAVGGCHRNPWFSVRIIIGSSDVAMQLGLRNVFGSACLQGCLSTHRSKSRICPQELVCPLNAMASSSKSGLDRRLGIPSTGQLYKVNN